GECGARRERRGAVHEGPAVDLALDGRRTGDGEGDARRVVVGRRGDRGDGDDRCHGVDGERGGAGADVAGGVATADGDRVSAVGERGARGERRDAGDEGAGIDLAL